jgi:hypothetical protein
MQRLTSLGTAFLSPPSSVTFGHASKQMPVSPAYPPTSSSAPGQTVFTVDYIDTPIKQHQYLPQNQPLINEIMSVSKKGRGIRSHFLGENYTERKTLHGIRCIASLMQQNVFPLHSQLAEVHAALNQRLSPSEQMALPRTLDISHGLLAKIEEHTAKGTGWRSYLGDENYPERQILRTSNYLMQACAHHFDGLYNMLDVIQQQADKLHPTGQTSMLPRPDNNTFLSEAAERKKEGIGFFGNFVLPENHTEIEGVRHLELFAKFLVNNMECLHQRLDGLKRQLAPQTTMENLNKPDNRSYMQQVARLADTGTGLRAHSTYSIHDPNFVERNLIEMLKPITHILVGNLESLQRKLHVIKP